MKNAMRLLPLVAIVIAGAVVCSKSSSSGTTTTVTGPTGPTGPATSLGDGSGTITLYTHSCANFAGQTLPAGAKTWTGYGVNFRGTTKEFLIRNTSDVQ